jgi:hypothetical protein
MAVSIPAQRMPTKPLESAEIVTTVILDRVEEVFKVPTWAQVLPLSVDLKAKNPLE